MTIEELKQPTTFMGLSDRVEDEIERAFWEMDSRRKEHGERYAFKMAVREMFRRLRKPTPTEDKP